MRRVTRGVPLGEDEKSLHSGGGVLLVAGRGTSGSYVSNLRIRWWLVRGLRVLLRIRCIGWRV
ncbi:hypothetical protein Dimus_037425, partial [Dionaea muscipula]